MVAIDAMKIIIKILGITATIGEKCIFGIKNTNPKYKNINSPIITPAGLLFLDIEIFLILSLFF
jgi:hypothetical protein